MIYIALYVMLLMRANPLLGQVGGGLVLGNFKFLDPKSHPPNGSMLFHRAQPPATCPRNGFLYLKLTSHKFTVQSMKGLMYVK
jgi:hypothetical protein